jgi:hypothetical protein
VLFCVVAWYAVGDDYTRGAAVVARGCVAKVCCVLEGVLDNFVDGCLGFVEVANAFVCLFWVFFLFFLRLLFKVRFALGFTGMGETALLLAGVIGAESMCLLKGVEVVGLLELLLAGVLGSMGLL